MAPYSNAKGGHAVSRVGAASSRCVFVPGKVIRNSGAVRFAVGTNHFRSSLASRKGFVNLRQSLHRWSGGAIHCALGFGNKEGRVRGYAANPVLKRTCLRATA